MKGEGAKLPWISSIEDSTRMSTRIRISTFEQYPELHL